MNANKSKANDIKHCVRKRGMTLKEWAELEGFKYRDVSDVVRGIRFGNYGIGRDILEKLNEIVDAEMPTKPADLSGDSHA